MPSAGSSAAATTNSEQTLHTHTSNISTRVPRTLLPPPASPAWDIDDDDDDGDGARSEEVGDWGGACEGALGGYGVGTSSRRRSKIEEIVAVASEEAGVGGEVLREWPVEGSGSQ